MDREQEARALFERTRNAMGYRSPEWAELHEETRQTYRDEVARRPIPTPESRE
jgi:hypothetical protein